MQAQHLFFASRSISVLVTSENPDDWDTELAVGDITSVRAADDPSSVYLSDLLTAEEEDRLG
jgi:hypothetical protein